MTLWLICFAALFRHSSNVHTSKCYGPFHIEKLEQVLHRTHTNNYCNQKRLFSGLRKVQHQQHISYSIDIMRYCRCVRFLSLCKPNPIK